MTESAPATAAGGRETAADVGDGRDASLGLAMAAVGAVVAAVACFLPWIRFDLGRVAVFLGTPSRSISASAVGLGVVGAAAIAASIVMLLCAAALFAGPKPPARTICAWLLAAAGAAVAAAAVMALATKGARADQVLRAAWQATTGGAQPAAQFDRLRDVLGRLGSRSSAGLGAYVAAAGGILGAAGGAQAALASSRAARADRRAAAAGGFDVGWSAERPA